MDDRDQFLAIAAQRLGNLLHVTYSEVMNSNDQRVIDTHVEDICRIPELLLERLISAGLSGVFVGTGRVARLDDLDYLATEPKHDNTPALYHRDRRIIAAGTMGRDPLFAHNMVHEFGHAAGHLLGLNEHPTLIAQHQTVEFWMRLPAYYRGIRPGDPVGCAELLAELFRDRILVGPRISSRFGTAFVRWLDEELGLQ